MEKPNIPVNEAGRLNALNEYHILDTLPETDLNNITKLASEICQTPISLISLVDQDRQWFKAKKGLEANETPRHVAFCAHAINTPNQPFIVNDSRIDERFSDNPLVTESPNVVFYAGIPLVNPDGFALGTLCIIDNEPRELTLQQSEALSILAAQVINIFELRKKNREFENAKNTLEQRNKELEKFASVVSHDIRSPLSNIISAIELFYLNYGDKLDSKGIKLLNLIKGVSFKLKDMVQGILEYYQSDPKLLHDAEEINLKVLLESILSLIETPPNLKIVLPDATISHQKSVLMQIFLNLITNSIRYNDKMQPEIEIRFKDQGSQYWFEVKDNGIGIQADQKEKIFNLFTTLNSKDTKGNYSSGIGLATVKKLINNQNGKIRVESIPGEETRISFTLEKRTF